MPQLPRLRVSRRAAAARGGASLTALVLAACGPSTSELGLVEVTPTAMPTELNCPSGNTVGTDGGLLAKLPDGVGSREEALARWLERFPRWGKRFVIDDDGSAWILRNDDTARARVTFIQHKGFTAHGYEECT